MNHHYPSVLWINFGAAIDMLRNAIVMCPDALWQKQQSFYYLSFHTTIFLDYYLTFPVALFRPVLPYVLIDPNDLPPGAIDDVMPARYYSREEMMAALSTIKIKCHDLIMTPDASLFEKQWIEENEIDLHGLCPTLVTAYTVLEILFYNLRHVQHHTGQLNMILRQEINQAPEWISWTEDIG